MGAWARYETGSLDERGVLSCLEREASEQGLVIDVRGFMQAFFAGFALNEPMLDVVRALKGKIALGCLTNTVRRNASTELFGVDPVALFDVVVASCEVGMRKPDPAIYELICRRLDVVPSAVVFLDDHAPNVEAAVASGLVGVLFRSVVEAIREIENTTGLKVG